MRSITQQSPTPTVRQIEKRQDQRDGITQVEATPLHPDQLASDVIRSLAATPEAARPSSHDPSQSNGLEGTGAASLLGQHLAPVLDRTPDEPSQPREARRGRNSHFGTDDFAGSQAEQGSASLTQGAPGSDRHQPPLHRAVLDTLKGHPLLPAPTQALRQVPQTEFAMEISKQPD